MARTNLTVKTVRVPTKLSRAIAIQAKLAEHDAALDTVEGSTSGVYTNTTRPLLLASWTAAGYPGIPAAGTVTIFNTDDNAPNFWDGTAWRDAMGGLT